MMKGLHPDLPHIITPNVMPMGMLRQCSMCHEKSVREKVSVSTMKCLMLMHDARCTDYVHCPDLSHISVQLTFLHFENFHC